MEFLIGLFVGTIIAGLFCYILSKRRKTSGTFIIDLTDPMKDICRLDLNESIDSIYIKKQIMLNVMTISQQ